LYNELFAAHCSERTRILSLKLDIFEKNLLFFNNSKPEKNQAVKIRTYRSTKRIKHLQNKYKNEDAFVQNCKIKAAFSVKPKEFLTVLISQLCPNLGIECQLL
jgi:hypothetical protein